MGREEERKNIESQEKNKKKGKRIEGTQEEGEMKEGKGRI